MVSPVQNISDTALLTALYRAQESERPDALFHDPYARMLAGERAELIKHTMPGGRIIGYPIVVCTCVLDEFITRTIQQQHVSTVLNLAAGLDTRPYRLNLPGSLRWIEVDLPEILAYKQEMLAAVIPACTLKRVACDLTNEKQRQEFFTHVNAEAESICIVTEGLLNYLVEQQVRTLALDLSNCEHICWWCTDMASPLLLRLLQLVWGRSLRSGDTRFQFAPSDDAQFFRSCGWHVEERSNLQIAHILNREVGLEKLFRWLSYLPSTTIRRTFRFGDNLLLKRRHASS